MEGRSAGDAAPGEAGGEEDAHGVVQQQVLVAKLTQSPETDRMLREELWKAKDDYKMATGAISSLQRQLEVQESQLRRTKSEKEMLQKKLRERENQLQAMSMKFCSLRDQRKHKDIMATIEQEKCSLRQLVTEQESTLAWQSKLISELQGRVSQLQAEALASQNHIQKQQEAQEAVQRQAETLQHKELQARVALERITSRFERFRSKVIQATFSTAGSKPPQGELTDEEVLEAMQKVINERTEFHQLLKQKGIQVPVPSSSDTSAPSPATAKARRVLQGRGF